MNSMTSNPGKQILSFDGGGVRGALSVAFLERIEQIYDEQTGSVDSAPPARHFDLIGGTSTGAVIASLLALGYRASEIKSLYFELAKGIFRRPWYRLKLFQPLFDAKYLWSEIERLMGADTLNSEALLTHLAIVTKRMDTGSAWIVSNNPQSKYWQDPADGSYIGNQHYRLADLVRASTAAPYFFTPHEVQICEGERPGLFVDGGISPHNNPALALFLLATIPSYGFGWPTGKESIRIISIGTGTYRDSLSLDRARRMPALALAVQALKSMVRDSNNEVMTLMQIFGHTDTPWRVNSEIEELKEVLLPQEPLFTFQRYDIRLERNWLREVLGINLSEKEARRLTFMEDPENVALLYEIGQEAARIFIKPDHVQKFSSGTR